ncbi:MAG: hypothetical protein JW787_15170 [Sedimentisphaerales bacterium]|nr:hypothetical protein [Sedimentisphaerales bacterium]
MEKNKLLLMFVFIVSLCLAFAAIAQDRGQPGAAGAADPAGRGPAAGRGMMGMGRGPAVRSPELLSDNKVTFRLSAPKASEVAVAGDWGTGMGSREAMTRDEQDVWSVTIGPLNPEFYGYTFSVDGVQVLDPANAQIKRDGTRNASVLLVPGAASDLYAVKDVPHGTLAKVWYDSPALNLKRRMYVYTPPGYESSSEKYPVFYLLHGGGGDEDAWTTLGRAPQILDNLIAHGKAKPMIVVMTNGNANQAAAQGDAPVSSSQTPGGMGTPGATPAARGGMTAMTAGGFENSLAKDVVPYIEKHYRVIADKDNRAVAGLSMGGGHTLRVTLDNPTMFGFIGVFSAGARNADDEMKKQFKVLKDANPKLYYVGCGVDDTLAYAGSQTLEGILKEYDFKYIFRESSGGHTWANWRIYLSELAPLLFK